jgi:hypothetical protein
MKYSISTDGFSSEINNNSNYHQSNVSIENIHMQPKPAEMSAYSFQMSQEASSRLNCAVESEKVLKRKHIDIDPISKQNPTTHHHSFHLNQSIFSKRDNSCLLQQSTSYYPSDLYTNFSSKPNDVYRTMEKFNNYITNN